MAIVATSLASIRCHESVDIVPSRQPKDVGCTFPARTVPSIRGTRPVVRPDRCAGREAPQQ
jgi:hypothetical protein